jgi:hypothetical protein
MSTRQKRLPRQRYRCLTVTVSRPAQYLHEKRRSRIPYIKEQVKKYIEMRSGSHSKTAERLLRYLEESNDFPDKELAENVEKARREFRNEFRLES